MTGDGGPDRLVSVMPGGYALLGPDGVRRVLYALHAAQRVSRVDGIEPPAEQRRLRSTLAAVLDGFRSEHAELPFPPVMRASEASSSEWADPIGTSVAATLLGCTDRNVRSLCGRGVFDTAGVRAGQWVIERAEVLQRAADPAGRDGSARDRRRFASHGVARQ